MAFEEAASVHAFVALENELARFGAPRTLVRAAACSARDEVRHARVMARLAGGHACTPRMRASRPRGLEAIARENAVEGCVKETFGALVLAWQAKHVSDRSLRDVFARIASDEMRHAALARAVASFCDGRLDARARRRITAARSRAVDALRHDLATRWRADPSVGLPSRPAATALFDAMIATLARG
jgi:hypothetical protein